jgi:hypothetical protein
MKEWALGCTEAANKKSTQDTRRIEMPRSYYFKPILAGAALAAIVLAGIMISSVPGKAESDDNERKIQMGFAIAPVTLHYSGKNYAEVGLGSYLVNAVGGCNDCHSSPSYASGGSPYLGQPKQFNNTTYLGGGGTPFGPVFIPRNLTPDKTGRPEGGASFGEFISVIRTGIDPDHAHPTFGPYLQVMPWPVYQSMTDSDLRAIYEYLSAIPCVEGDPGLPNPRPIGTRCGAPGSDHDKSDHDRRDSDDRGRRDSDRH